MRAPIIGIDPHRILTDGKGVTTLVGFQGCPLRCKYCLNPHSIADDFIAELMSVEELIDHLSKDDIYFRATGGGVCFTGGEPLLHTDFIKSFREKAPKRWNIYIETSLNVDIDKIKAIEEIIDGWIIDIKDMNPEIYKDYTGVSNLKVLSNLKYLASKNIGEKITIRIPEIPSYNNDNDLSSSKTVLLSLGFSEDQFDLKLKYKDPNKIAKKKKYGISTKDIPIETLFKLHSEGKKEANSGSYTPPLIGKAICHSLYEIRKQIAQIGNIYYTPQECNHKGGCSGSCPMCEEELEILKDIELNLTPAEQTRLFDTAISAISDLDRHSLNPSQSNLFKGGMKQLRITRSVTQGRLSPPHPLQLAKANSIDRLRRQGLTIEEISKITGLTIDEISKFRNK